MKPTKAKKKSRGSIDWIAQFYGHVDAMKADGTIDGLGLLATKIEITGPRGRRRIEIVLEQQTKPRARKVPR